MTDELHDELGLESDASGGTVGDLPTGEPEPGMPPGEIPEAGPPGDGFTAPEKITSVVRATLAMPAEPKVRGLLAMITSPLGDRLLLRPLLALLPPLDEPGEWDEWLAILAGCALELVSDGVNVDVDASRGQARVMLAALFDEGQG